MHKRLSSVIAILLVLLSITACQDKAVDMTSAIPLSVSVSEPDEVKLITYDGSVAGVSGDIETVEISVYEGSSATGTPEATGTLSLSGGSATAVITNVIPGLYTITADGYSGTHQLTHDSITKRIIPSSSDVSIVLSTFQTADPVGTITITPSFSDDAMASAIESGNSFTASWTLYGGEALAEETATGTASISSVPFTLIPSTGSIAPGRYILKATVTSDGKSYYAVSALRLLPGLPASGDLVFGLDGGAGESGGESLTLVVTDSTGAVIPMTDGGIVSDDDTYTLSISGLTKEPQSVIVYANGERLTPTAMSYSSGVEKVELTITESAIYDILVVVLDGTASGVGSLHFEMTVNKPTFIIKGDASDGDQVDFEGADRYVMRFYPNSLNVPSTNSHLAKAAGRQCTYSVNYSGDNVYRVVSVSNGVFDMAWGDKSYAVIEPDMYIMPGDNVPIWFGGDDLVQVSGCVTVEVEKVNELPTPDISIEEIYNGLIGPKYSNIPEIKLVDGTISALTAKVWQKGKENNIRTVTVGSDLLVFYSGTGPSAPGLQVLGLTQNSSLVACIQFENSDLGLGSVIHEIQLYTDSNTVYTKTLETPSWYNEFAEIYCYAGGNGFITRDSLTAEDKQIMEEETGSSLVSDPGSIYLRDIDPSIEYHYKYETTDVGHLISSVKADINSPILEVKEGQHVYSLSVTGTQQGSTGGGGFYGNGTAIAIFGYKEGYKPFHISYSGNP